MSTPTRQYTFDYAMSLGGKSVPGRVLINTANGDAEWYAGGDTYPTFTSSSTTGGPNNWGWTPATNTSVSNLRSNEYLTSRGLNYTTDDALLNDFYTGNSIQGLNNQRAAVFNNNNLVQGQNLGVPGVRQPSSGAGGGGDGASDDPADGSTPSSNQESAGTTEQNIDLEAASQLVVTGQSANQLSKDVYRYPTEGNIENNKSDYIRFTAYTYGNRGFESGNIYSFENRSTESTGKSVILPIQPSIVDNNGARWNEGTLTPLQIAGANVSLGTITGGTEGLKTALTNALKSSSNASKDIESIVALYMSEQAVQAQLTARLTGAIINPNLELLFEGPTLRPFTFNFKLSPRDKDEANTVKAIIRFFKLNMAPQTTEGNLFLKAPNVFEIEYIYGPTGEKHKGLNRIKKPCALQSFSVDYTPDGSYMTFDETGDGSPSQSMVSYSLAMQFMELEPVYAKDYNDIPEDEIGF